MTGRAQPLADLCASQGRRLLFVVSRGRLDPAGRKRVYDLLPLFQRTGHKVRVLSYDWELLWQVRARAEGGSALATRVLRTLNAWRLTPLLMRSRAAHTRARFARLVAWADVVIVNQTPLDERWRARLRDTARAVAYDVDDAVWLRGGAEAQMLALADVVVAGNAFLAGRLARLHPNVVTIPTCVRLDRYERVGRRGPTGAGCVIGWVGSPSTVKYLELLVEPLAELGAEVPMVLELVGTQRASLPRFRNVQLRVHPRVPYDPDDFVPRFDIGVMPLTDGEWERGKCAAKALEYMAAGVPVVCSAVGEAERVVGHEVAGLLVKTPPEWVAALRRLATDRRLRTALGREGQARVRAAFSAVSAVERWNACFAERLAGTGAPRRAAPERADTASTEMATREKAPPCGC